MKECNLLQTYDIFLKLIYFKLLQEYWTYEYDALNHRISRSCGEETTKYAYGRNGALAYQEKTKDGSVTKRSFAYLNDEIIGFTDKLGEAYFITSKLIKKRLPFAEVFITSRTAPHIITVILVKSRLPKMVIIIL